MNKTLFLLLAASALFAAGAYGQAVQTPTPVRLTLQECLEYAARGNYARQSVQMNEELRESSLEQSRMDRLPAVSAGVSESVSHTNSGGTGWNGNYDVSAGMTLYQGGQINNTVKQNELQYEQTQLQTQQYDNGLVIQVLESFLAALGNEELLKYQEAVAETSREQAGEGKKRLSAGQIIESDYLLLEAQYAVDLNNITASRINRSNSLVALKNLMAMELTRQIELVYPDDSVIEEMLELPSQNEFLERGMTTLPDIRISEYNVRIAETGLEISRSALYPTVSLSAGLGTGHSPDFRNFGTQLSDRFGPQAGISASIPIFNRNNARSGIKQSKIALRQSELEHRQSLADIEQTLISEYGNVVSSASTFKASEVRQNAYLSSFRAYTEMFRAGAITAVELLQQQNNYISAMNEYVRSKYTFMLQRRVLDVYMGEPVKM